LQFFLFCGFRGKLCRGSSSLAFLFTHIRLRKSLRLFLLFYSLPLPVENNNYSTMIWRPSARFFFHFIQMRIFVIYISSTFSHMRLCILFIFLLISYLSFAGQHRDTIPAHYPGGQVAWIRYLIKEFRIPDGVLPEQLSARLQFHVSSSGKISQVIMISGETLLLPTFTRLLVKSAPWVPAMIGIKPIASLHTLPITYHLEH
jgi:hypothetical protein